MAADPIKSAALIGTDTLFIIPCCASKEPDGRTIGSYRDPMRRLVSEATYAALLGTRKAVLQSVLSAQKFTVDNYQKNTRVSEGPDFGGVLLAGNYMPALSRYVGTLYCVPGFKTALESSIDVEGKPQVMILSALYGPLHPLSEIQDYNLMMSDAPAREWTNFFPAFLEDYVKRNGVKKIRLYLGTSTAYFRVAKKAVSHLKKMGLVTEAVQYHIVDGGTRKTPPKHGARLLCDLGSMVDTSLYDSQNVRENFL